MSLLGLAFCLGLGGLGGGGCDNGSEKLVVLSIDDRSGTGNETRVFIKVAGGKQIELDGPVPAGVGVYVPGSTTQVTVTVEIYRAGCLVGASRPETIATPEPVTQVAVTVLGISGACGVDGGAGGVGGGAMGGTGGMVMNGGSSGTGGAGGTVGTGGITGSGGMGGVMGMGGMGMGGMGAGGIMGAGGMGTGGVMGMGGMGMGGMGMGGMGMGGIMGAGGMGMGTGGASGGGMGGTTMCLRDNECPSGSYCDRPCDLKNQVGICVEIPSSERCPRNYMPVCGCDRVTYENDCLRNSKKVGKAHDGPCDRCSLVTCMNGQMCCPATGQCYSPPCLGCCPILM